MATVEWLCCGKCGKIEQYAVLDNGSTSVERGHFLGHRDFIASGFKSQVEAEKYLYENYPQFVPADVNRNRGSGERYKPDLKPEMLLNAIGAFHDIWRFYEACRAQDVASSENFYLWASSFAQDAGFDLETYVQSAAELYDRLTTKPKKAETPENV